MLGALPHWNDWSRIITINTHREELVQFRVGLGIHGHFEQRVEQVVEELLEVLKELVDAVDIAVQRFNKFSFASRFLKS